MQLAHINLGQALKVAVKLDLVPSNVVDAIDQPRYRAREMEYWSSDEAQRFIAVPDQSIYWPIWLLALVTELRKGELLGLRWQDIDWEGRALHIRQTAGTLHSKVQFKGAKRPKSRRAIDLDDAILAVLRAHRPRQNGRRLQMGSAWQDHDLVFPSTVGTPVNGDNCDKDFNRLVKLAGVKRIRIHDTRHSYATLAILSGVLVHVVSKSMAMWTSRPRCGRTPTSCPSRAGSWRSGWPPCY